MRMQTIDQKFNYTLCISFLKLHQVNEKRRKFVT